LLGFSLRSDSDPGSVAWIYLFIYYKNRTRSTKYRIQNKIQYKMHTTNPEGEIMSIAWKYRIQNKIHTTNQEVHMMSIESAMSA